MHARPWLRVTFVGSIAVASFAACSSGEGTSTEKTGSVQESITTACTAEQIGAPCDPDGGGTATECDGTCTIVLGTGGIATPTCTKAVAGSNDGKLCGTTATGKSDCNKVCSGSTCTAKAAASGTACKPLDGSGSICDGQCKSSSGGTGMTCVALTSTEKCPPNVAGDCKYDFCEPLNSMKCVSYPLPTGSACDDRNSCTNSDSCSSLGVCAGTSSPAGSACPGDGDPCTLDRCDGLGACKHPAVDCDDKNGCTVDACSTTGACTHVAKVCPSDACHTPTCEPSTGVCGLKGITCDDKDPCTTDSCDVTKGCVFVPIPGCTDAGVVDSGPADTGTTSDTGSTGTDTGTPGSDTGTPGSDTGTTGEDTGGSTGSDTGTAPIDSGSSFDGATDDSGLLDDPGPEIKGGCGCRTTSSSSAPKSALAILGLAALFARRRRHRC